MNSIVQPHYLASRQVIKLDSHNPMSGTDFLSCILNSMICTHTAVECLCKASSLLPVALLSCQPHAKKCVSANNGKITRFHCTAKLKTQIAKQSYKNIHSATKPRFRDGNNLQMVKHSEKLYTLTKNKNSFQTTSSRNQ